MVHKFAVVGGKAFPIAHKKKKKKLSDPFAADFDYKI